MIEVRCFFMAVFQIVLVWQTGLFENAEWLGRWSASTMAEKKTVYTLVSGHHQLGECLKTQVKSCKSLNLIDGTKSKLQVL